MAKPKIPDPLMRRHLVERQQSPEQALEIAEAYLAEDRTEEAIIFLQKAGAEDRLDELQEAAIESGDVFLLQEIARIRKRELAQEVWERVEACARAAGKDLYAAVAHRQVRRSDDPKTPRSGIAAE